MAETVLLKAYSWKFILLLAAAYFLLCLLLYVGQNRLIYFPSARVEPLPVGFQPWLSPSGTERWGYKKVSGSTNCLFFFHGNGGNASGWAHAVADFPGDIYVLEYPGYGGRTGTPSEASLKEAALIAFQAEHKRYETLVLAGQSLGAAITQAIFSKHPDEVDRLALITPFSSLRDMAHSQFPWVPTRWILRDQMALLEPWRGFSGKTVVVLAGADEIIPTAQNLKYMAARSDDRHVLELPGRTHNAVVLPRTFWEHVLEWHFPENFLKNL